MKLYSALVRFFRAASHLYFAEVHAAGRHRVPRRGPLMLAANHPGSILDSILLSTQVPRPVHYLARSGLFRWSLLATLFRRLGAVPVYRRDETDDHARRNVDAFGKVFELFEAGGCVGIFPEGRNSPTDRVGPLRSGTARLALGAEARNGYRLGLRIVPVGITFERRELLMSAVLLRFGTPIAAADYAALHRDDPGAAVRRLTDDLQQALRRQTLHIEDRQIGDMAADIAAVLGQVESAHPAAEADDADAPRPSRARRWLWRLLAWYRRRSPAARTSLDRRLYSRQRINEVLTRAHEHDPDAVAALRQQVDRHKDHLGQTELRQALQASLDYPVRERLPRLRMTLYAIGVAPIAAFGLVHNVVPYLLTQWISRRFDDEAVRAFAGFLLGVAAFTATYALLGAWLWKAGGLSLAATLAYLAALPPTGLVALGYRRNILVYRDRILVRTFLWNHGELAELLREERAAIAERFDALAQRYRREWNRGWAQRQSTAAE